MGKRKPARRTAKRKTATSRPKNGRRAAPRKASSSAELERRLTEALDQQAATSAILRVISSSPASLEPVAQLIADSASRLCACTYVAVFRFDGELIHWVAARHASREQEEALRVSWPRPANRETLVGRTILADRLVHVHDAAADPTYGQFDLTARATLDIRTFLGVPMLRDGQPIGVIAVVRTDVRPFSEREIALVQTFADQAVIAMENVRQFTEARDRNRDLAESLDQQTATSEILGVISRSPTDIQPVLDAVVESAARLCDSFDSAVWRHAGDHLVLAAHHGAIPSGSMLPVARGTSNGRAVLEARTIHLADMQAEAAEYPEGSENARRRGHRTILVVPLMREGAAIGTIQLRRTEVRLFSARQVALLQTFADQAVIAMENVRLFTELAGRNRDLTDALDRQTATGEILRAISQAQADVQPVFEAIADNAMRLFGAWSCTVYRYDGELIRLAAARGGLPGSGEAVMDELRAPRAPTDDAPRDRAALTGAVQHATDVETDPHCGPRFRDLARARGFRSAIAVPMLQGGRVAGVIGVTKQPAGGFAPAEIALLETFADQAVIAVENARLLTELQARNADLTESLEQQTATSEILRTISTSPTDLQPVLQTVAQNAARLCAADDGHIWQRDRSELHLAASWGGLPVGRPRLTIGRHSVVGRAAHDMMPVHVSDLAAVFDTEFPDSGRMKDLGYRTILTVPLLREGLAIGVIMIRRTEVRPFTDKQVDLVKTFADQAVIAIENVRLFTELDARNGELRVALEQQTATGEILSVISSSPTDVQPVFDTIVTSAARLCAGDLAFLFSFDGRLIHFRAHHGLSPEGDDAMRAAWPQPPKRGSVAARCILERGIAHIPDVQADPEYQHGHVAAAANFRAAIAVPMLRDGVPLGAISVNRAQAGPFSARQIELLETFADQAVIAIENVRLFTELDARNRDLTESLEQQTATSEILRVISRSPTDIQPVLDAVAESAARLTATFDAIILLREGDHLHLAAHRGSIPNLSSIPLVRGTTNGRTVLDGRTIHVGDLQTETEEYPEGSANARRLGYRTILCVPLMKDGAAIGAINLRRPDVRLFTDRQVALLETFADQAVIAIENVRLFTELDARNSELRVALEQQTATSELLKVIGRSTFDLQPVFATLAENAVRLCEAERGCVFQFDGQVLRIVEAHNMSAALWAFFEQNPLPPERNTTAGRAALERHTVHIHDVLSDPDYQSAGPQVDPYRTVLAIPMLRADDLLGVIVIYRHEVRAFSDGHITLMETFADQAAIAIENARLLTELQAKNASLTESLEQQTATSEILRVISRSPTDIQPVLDAIAESSARLCEAPDVTVFLREADHLRGAGRYGSIASDATLPLSRAGAAGSSVLDGRTIHVLDMQTEDAQFPASHDNARRLGFRTVLNVPLMREGVAIGAIILRRVEAQLFTERQVALLQTFADQAVIAIENVRLFTELETRNSELRVSLEQQTATSELLKVIGRSTFGLEPVFETLAENTVRLCEAERAFVYRFDGQALRVVATHNVSPALRDFVEQHPILPGRHSASARAALEGRSIHIHDSQADPELTYGGNYVDPVRTVLAVPMLRTGELLGAIFIYRLEVRPFTDSQIALMETFADQAAIAIENARLLTELQAKNTSLTESLEQQTATSEILRVISSSPTDIQPVLDAVAESSARLCEAPDVIIFLREADRLRAAGRHGSIPYDEGLPLDPRAAASWAVLEGQPTHVADMQTEDGRFPVSAENARRLGFRTVLNVPLMREGIAIGLITLRRAEAQLFTDRQVVLLQTFADQAVIAIENVRLFKELEVRNRDLTETLEQQTATGDILRVISSSPTDVQPVFTSIAQSARRLCEADFCAVLRFDSQLLHFVAHDGLAADALEAARSAFPMPADRGSAGGRSILDAAVAQIPDVHADQEYRLEALARAATYRSLAAVPMLRDGVPIGTIVLQRSHAGLLPDRQVVLLRTFADQAVIAIENVRLFTELAARNGELRVALEQQTATSELLKVIGRSTFDLQPVFDTLAENAVRLCEGDQAYIFRLAAEGLRVVAAHGPPELTAFFQRAPIAPGRGSVAGRAALEGRTVHVHDVEADPTYTWGALLQVTAVRTVLAIPMVRSGEVLGVIGVNRVGVARAFTDGQIALMETFADQAAIAIENARLLTELQERTGQLTRSVGELEALGEVSRAVGSTLDLETVLATIVSRAVALSGSDGGVVYEFEEATQSFHPRATHQVAPEQVEAARATPIRLGEGAMGRAGVTREPVLVADIQAEEHLVAPQVRVALRREGLRSLLALPLVREDRLLGGLVILRRAVGAFSPEVVATLQTFATQSVLAIHNAGLFREAQRQQQYSKTLVETSPVAIVTLDLGGRVIGWNPGAVRLFGYPEAEALDRLVEDLIATNEMRWEIQANLAQNLRGEQVRVVTRRARKDGTLVDVEISSMPLVVDGDEVGTIATYHDITELLQARREAEAANEAKSAFLATMSHEIRTPMNAVIGMSGLLLNTSLNDEQREYAEVVRQSGDALLTVINDILDFSKIEAGRLELEAQPFDLRECVEGALDLVATRAAEKGVDLAYVLGDGTPPAIVGDVTRLRQVLLNLLSNAVKFTEEGEIVCSVATRPLPGAAPLHELTFSVRDTGIGIPPDRVDRLFQSFSQVDASTTRRYGGTGLGLAISQRLTELMGGRIEVTSEVGRGSDFRFTIRAEAAAELPVPARRDLSGVQPSLRGKRVLVVDDNATNRRILTVNFQAWGMFARATESPLEALDWIAAGEQFDAGILDMHMPEMDGIALAHALRARPAGATLPLVLFTSLGRREARAEEEGFAAYLHKPIKPSQLFDTLISVLAEHAAPVAERREPRSELDPEMARRHPLRILLAEDNVVNQKVALRLLAQMGYRADMVANGLEAVDAVARQRYDVVLMDVQMPELDGFGASREINRRWPEVRPRIVAMTANAMQGDRELCEAAGMDDYVAKPIRVEELVAALERCGQGAVPDEGAANAPPAAGRPAGVAAAVDRAALDQLVATMGGPFVAEIIDTFVEDGRALLATLQREVGAAGLDEFRRAAHSLKSNADTLGAKPLAGLARELEAMARAGSLDGAAGRLGPLAHEYERAVQALGELQRGLSA